MSWRLTFVVVALAFVTCFSTADDKPTKKTDEEAILGEWKFSEFESEGYPFPAEAFPKNRYIFKKEGKLAIIIQTAEGKLETLEAKFKLDPAKEPKHIDFSIGEGAMKKESQGIYKLDGDSLTICATISDKKTEYPKVFKTQKESGTCLTKFQRVKP